MFCIQSGGGNSFCCRPLSEELLVCASKPSGCVTEMGKVCVQTAAGGRDRDAEAGAGAAGRSRRSLVFKGEVAESKQLSVKPNEFLTQADDMANCFIT